MLHAVLFQDGIPCPDGMGLAVHGKFKRARHHISDLGVRVVMQSTHGSFFKGVLHAHQAVGISQHPAGDARPGGLRQSLSMVDPALFLFRQIHIHFLVFCRNGGVFRVQKPMESL